jgi:hypothetical protein
MIETENANKLGFQLIKALSDMVNAKTRLDVLMLDKGVHPDTRFLLKRVSGHVTTGITQFKKGLDKEY